MTGSLQVKNGKYYMVLNSTENGKRKQKWISTGLPEKGNKRKAEQMLREKLTEEEKRNPVVCSDMTVADCVRRWLIRMRRRVDEVTYRSYQHTAETHILPYFDENRLKLCDCTVEVLQTYFDEKYRNGRKDGKGGLSSKTMRHHKGILGQALAECVKDGLIPSNPCQYVEMPRRERHEAHFYSAEQLQQLITALNGDPIQPLVKIAALYGLRRSELLGLKWDSIDFENGMVLIRHTVCKMIVTVEKDKTKTQSSRRSFPMTEEAREIFLKAKAEEEAKIKAEEEARAKAEEEARKVEEQKKLENANCIKTAKQYINYTAFSREGLIHQLEYEGYSTESAEYSVDSLSIDWNAQCAKMAKQYLDYTGFSRDGLYDQLQYEGFSNEQIEYGLSQVGY